MAALYLSLAGMFCSGFWLIYIWGACPHSLFSPPGSFFCQIFPRIPLWANPVVLGNVPSVYFCLAIGHGFSLLPGRIFLFHFAGFATHTRFTRPPSTHSPPLLVAAQGYGALAQYYTSATGLILCVCVCLSECVCVCVCLSVCASAFASVSVSVSVLVPVSVSMSVVCGRVCLHVVCVDLLAHALSAILPLVPAPPNTNKNSACRMERGTLLTFLDT